MVRLNKMSSNTKRKEKEVCNIFALYTCQKITPLEAMVDMTGTHQYVDILLLSWGHGDDRKGYMTSFGQWHKQGLRKKYTAKILQSPLLLLWWFWKRTHGQVLETHCPAQITEWPPKVDLRWRVWGTQGKLGGNEKTTQGFCDTSCLLPQHAQSILAYVFTICQHPFQVSFT